MTRRDPRFPDVSIVVPNWNGRLHLERCFASIETLAYPGRIEPILVDNGSTDGSAGFMAKRFPGVKVIRHETNRGFSAAVNRGAKEASGEVVAFLNNDMRVDTEWLTELVRPIVGGEACCTSSLILSWDGTRVNFAGGGMNFHGIGIQVGMDDTNLSRHREPKATLFACGGAMAIRQDALVDAGAFDEDFFAYYEDVDLGWRLWVLGETVRYVPSSVVYHHHSATSRRVDVHRIRLLQIRNPLLTIFKNYEDENLKKALPAALLVTLRRTKYFLNLDEREYTMEGNPSIALGPLARLRGRGRARLKGVTVPMAALADILAINDFFTMLPRLLEKRRGIQARRRREDAKITPLFLDPFLAVESPPEYSELQGELLRFFGLDRVLKPTTLLPGCVLRRDDA